MTDSFNFIRARHFCVLLIAIIGGIIFLLNPSPINSKSPPAQPLNLDKIGTLWSPYLEWSLDNPTFSGNPYDLVATVTFTHTATNQTRTTEMFYDGGTSWKFRFTGTLTGSWTFSSNSADADLNGHTGSITINPNSNPAIPGFVTKYGNKWGKTGLDEAFVPQFVMYSEPHAYFNNPAKIDADIQTYLVNHGFNGFHSPVYCRWFHLNDVKCNNNESDPDRQTFEALETLITKTHAAGGVVHLWMWGDDQRQWTPHFVPGGINGSVDKRLQRYIAARLGPLPGWTVGYGFDLFEWTTEAELTAWHTFMHSKMGWEHYLGARSNKNELNQISEAMDYSSYEQHKPDYNKYVETIEARPHKPSFSEDRFRIIDNNSAPKHYNMVETRRGLWHSAMAGGVANIWGNLPGGDDVLGSSPYPNPEWIKTNTLFFQNRFKRDLIRCNNLTDGVCLKTPDNANFIFYKEDASSIQLDLTDASGLSKAIAVDAQQPYTEIDILSQLTATNQTWTAPQASDWAIAVGEFSPSGADTSPPTVPANARILTSTLSSIALGWTPSIDNESGVSYYKIYRDGAFVSSTFDTTFTDTGLSINSGFQYHVSAVNGVELESEKTPVLLANTYLNFLYLPIIAVALLLLIGVAWFFFI